MENLEIKSTVCTPNVMFDIENKTLSITGKAYPEDAVSYFNPINSTLEEYIKNNDSLQIICEFVYLNTASTKMLLTLLKNAVNNLNKVKVMWGYEEDDDDILELGEDFADTLEIEFEFRVFTE